MPEVIVIGGGNMGAALVAGLLANDSGESGDAGDIDRPAITIVEVSAARRDQLSQLLAGVQVTGELAESLPNGSTAVIAVKPPDAPAAAAAAARAGVGRVISIAAGVTIATLQAAVEGLGDHPVAVVRAMPNTPALIGRGVTAICAGSSASPADLEEARRILAAVGICIDLAEHHFDAVTALSGSGPAYLFAMAEALIAAGLDAGLPSDLVEGIVIELLAGSAALLSERGDPAGLRAMVTSPNGTTAAGLAALEAHGFADAIAAAVGAAAHRSAELASG